MISWFFNVLPFWEVQCFSKFSHIEHRYCCPISTVHQESYQDFFYWRLVWCYYAVLPACYEYRLMIDFRWSKNNFRGIRIITIHAFSYLHAITGPNIIFNIPLYFTGIITSIYTEFAPKLTPTASVAQSVERWSRDPGSRVQFIAGGLGVAFFVTGPGWVLKWISFWPSTLPYVKKTSTGGAGPAGASLFSQVFLLT